VISRRLTMAALLAATVAAAASSRLGAQGPLVDTSRGNSGATRLAPTLHPPLPGVPSRYWLLPDAKATRSSNAVAETSVARFARGAALIADQQYAAGLPLVTAATLAGTPLAPYVQYYTALGLAGTGRSDEAEGVLSVLASAKPAGYLKEAVALQLADIAIASFFRNAAYADFEPDAARWPTVASFVGRALAHDAFASTKPFEDIQRSVDIKGRRQALLEAGAPLTDETLGTPTPRKGMMRL